MLKTFYNLLCSVPQKTDSLEQHEQMTEFSFWVIYTFIKSSSNTIAKWVAVICMELK